MNMTIEAMRIRVIRPVFPPKVVRHQFGANTRIAVCIGPNSVSDMMSDKVAGDDVVVMLMPDLDTQPHEVGCGSAGHAPIAGIGNLLADKDVVIDDGMVVFLVRGAIVRCQVNPVTEIAGAGTY